MYKGINGATSATNIDPLSRLKMAIVGKPKQGKSHFASTAPGEIYFFDFDSRKESLAGKPHCTVKTYRDVLPKNPKAIQQLEQDLAMFEYHKTQNIPVPDTYVFDSMTHWVKAAELELMAKSSRLVRGINFGTGVLTIPSGWDVITAIRNHMEHVLARAYELGNVICIFHEEPEKDSTRSKPEEPVYTGKYVVHPFYLRTLLSSFNEVWRIEIAGGGEYIVTTQATSNFGASTTLKIDKTEKPNIAAIIAKHKAATAKV
ncbi:MAG TPA: AAA family ATPase [Candidatus Saccharimonadales bacterium]